MRDRRRAETVMVEVVVMLSVDISRCGEEEQVCAGSLPTDLREGKAFACRQRHQLGLSPQP